MTKKTFKLKPFKEKDFRDAVKASDDEMKGKKTGHLTKIATAKEIRVMRKTVHLNQVELALALGSSASRIRSWEQGKRSPDGLTSKVIRLIVKRPALLKELEKV